MAMRSSLFSARRASKEAGKKMKGRGMRSFAGGKVAGAAMRRRASGNKGAARGGAAFRSGMKRMGY